VEIPEAAVEAGAEELKHWSFPKSPEFLARSVIEAALPYLAPACLGDGVCTNPQCATHGIEWTAVPQPVDREALRLEIAGEISGIQVGSGYESVTIGITAALEAADAVLALLGRSVLAGEQEQAARE
jgi:hypothetical protein